MFAELSVGWNGASTYGFHVRRQAVCFGSPEVVDKHYAFCYPHRLIRFQRNNIVTEVSRNSVKICYIERLADGDPRLSGYGIDSPVTGNEAPDRFFDLTGWFLSGAGAPGRSIGVYSEDQLITRIPVNLKRPNVVKRFQFGAKCMHCGFKAFVGTLGLRRSFEVEVRAVLKDKTVVPLARVNGEQRLIDVEYQAKRQPLLITALGRSGTTWVSHLLAQHPNILAARGYPYEVREGQYWMHVLYVLGSPADHHHSTHPDAVAKEPFWVGHNPYFHPRYVNMFQGDRELTNWFGDLQIGATAGFCQRRIDEFYDHICRIQQEPNPGRYFVEKTHPGRTPPLFYLMYPGTKELFLVRDFRDMICSQVAFNTKRGFQAFGRERAESDEQWLESVAKAANRMAAAWQQQSEQAFLLRYEDLVRRPEETLRNVCAYLEIEDSQTVVRKILTDAKNTESITPEHRTTRDAESSIGRWKSDFNEDWKARIKESFAEPMRLFGYTND